MEITEKTKKEWMNRALREATPGAGRWAHYVMHQEKVSFADFEDAFNEIVIMESSLYEDMKINLVKHISRHGLTARGLDFLEAFKKVDLFSFHAYEAVLRKVRRAFAADARKIEQLKSRINETSNYDVRCEIESNLADIEREAEDLEYLISKINEYLRKVRDLSNQIFELRKSGQAPDFATFKNQAVINDRLFEENKQFLKQTLHHIETLVDGGCKMGVAEIRLLLYHKEGCRRQKLQSMVEENIISIFNQLDNDDERRLIYPEICAFVKQIVPAVGHISPLMVSFIFDRGFVSADSRDLLLQLKSVICGLNMTPLILTPLQKYYDATVKHLRSGMLNETDEYVLQLMQAYNPKGLTPKVVDAWKVLKS